MENELNTLIESLDAINGENVPQWALLLIKSMKGLITVFSNFNAITQRLEILESNKSIHENTSSLLQADNFKLNERIDKLELKIDDQEQRSRNACLMIHGVKENPNENTDNIALAVINDDLGLENITIDDIERSHRVGPLVNQRMTRANSGKRPIIIRFTSYRKRREVFITKKRLKGKNISITENLTQIRYTLYKAAITKYGIKNVWTIDGRVTTKIDGNIKIINSTNDLA